MSFQKLKFIDKCQELSREGHTSYYDTFFEKNDLTDFLPIGNDPHTNISYKVAHDLDVNCPKIWQITIRIQEQRPLFAEL